MSIINLPQDVLDKLDFLHLEVFKRFQFAVSIDGDFFGSQFIVGFERIIGVGDSVDVRDVREGGHPGVYYFPRRSRRDTISLVRGMTLNKGLWNWFDEVRNWKKGKPNYARTMSIMILDHISPPQTKGQPIQFEVWRFDFVDAWPSEWRGPELSAQDEELAFESITVQHGGITRAKSLISGEVANIISLFQ